MDSFHENWSNNGTCRVVGMDEEEAVELRRGPWTVDEDLVLMNYIAIHGEGRWNSLAQSAGLKRTGKSCRLRWLNYLRPDVRRGNITPEEQLLILQLHSRFGNRWSKIAQHMPGRTDNEIKNYWRTRVQKHAKNLQCDVNSKKFKDIMQYMWIPRLLEKIKINNQALEEEFKRLSPENNSSRSSSDSHDQLAATAAAAEDNCFNNVDVDGLLHFDHNIWTTGAGGLDNIPDSFWSFDDIWSLQQQQF